MHAEIPSELKNRLVTTAEIADAGLSVKSLAGPDWKRVQHGLYRWTGLTMSARLMLDWVHSTHPAAVFSHETAGHLHRLDYPGWNPVTANFSRDRKICARAGVRVNRLDLEDSEI